jgi:hypothetical protein
MLAYPAQGQSWSGKVVHRVGDLDLVSGVAAEQVAVLVAEVSHDGILFDDVGLCHEQHVTSKPPATEPAGGLPESDGDT